MILQVVLIGLEFRNEVSELKVVEENSFTIRNVLLPIVVRKNFDPEITLYHAMFDEKGN